MRGGQMRRAGEPEIQLLLESGEIQAPIDVSIQRLAKLIHVFLAFMFCPLRSR